METNQKNPEVYNLDPDFGRRTKILFLIYGLVGLALAVLL